MADTIQIERWHRPWAPASDARLVETLNYYDRPLIGIIEQHGVKHLFRCVGGHIEPHHVWIYTCVTGSEADALVRTNDPEKLEALIGEFFAQGPVAVAAADDADGVWGSTIIDAFTVEELRTGYDRIIREFHQYLKSKQKEAAASHPLSTSASS